MTHSIKSGRHAPGIVCVVVVGVAVVVHKAEIVAVAGINGTAPVIGCRRVNGALPHDTFSEIHPLINDSLFLPSPPVCVTF